MVVLTTGRAGAAPPAVPGLLLDRLLGAGRFGPVWRALDVGSGEPVAVRVGLAAGVDASSAAREGALLRRLEHENVVRVRAVVDLSDGRRAVVTDLAAGGSLAVLIERRGELPAGEVATIAAAVAIGLAVAHAHGFVHGRLTARDVLFDASGRPQLADLGLGALLAAAGGDTPAVPVHPSPAGDVAALGEVVRWALRGGAGGLPAAGPLRGLVEACRGPEAGRPDADRVARQALSGAPVPVALLGAPPGGAVGVPVGGIPPGVARSAASGELPDDPGTPLRASGLSSRGRRGRRLTVLAAAAAAVVAGVALIGAALALALHTGGAQRARPVGRPAPSSSVPAGAASGAGAPVPPDVAALVTDLAAARARAFSVPSEPALALVDAPGSAAMTADAAFVRRLREQRLRLSGLAFAVSSVRLLGVDAGSASARARVATSGYGQVRADGSVARRVPAAAGRDVWLTLVRTPSGWRVASAR